MSWIIDSVFIQGGDLDGKNSGGDRHPTNIGDGELKLVAKGFEENLWEPLVLELILSGFFLVRWLEL